MFSFLPFASLFMSFTLADIGSAISGVASLLAGYLSSVLVFVLVIAGYLYMTSIGDAQNSVHAKRAIGAAIAGGILVAVAVNLAPALVSAFQK